MKPKYTQLAAAILLAGMATGIAHGETPASEEVREVPWTSAADAAAKGNEMPNPAEYNGLSRTVLEYSDAFNGIVERIKEPDFSDADWAPLEKLVDVENFQRMGVFLGDTAEVIGWEQYKSYISQYGGATSWAGTLRRITEVPGLVVLELEERNTINGVTGVSNTVTIYEFNHQGKLRNLDVYVMPLPE